MIRFPSLLLAASLLALPVTSQAEETALFNVADNTLGATAKGAGAKFNKDWLPQKALSTGNRGGTIFDPFKGATIDIRLVIPVEIEAVEIQGLDYRGTKFPSGVDIFIEGKKVASAELPDSPEAVRIPAKGFGQNLQIAVTGSHPVRTLKDGKKGPNYGGFKSIKVLSPTDLAQKMTAPKEYQVTPLPAAIAPTAAEKGSVDVFVEVRQTEGHPNTYWDTKDIEEFRKMLKESPLLQEQFAALKRAMDERMSRDLGVPAPEKDENGKWLHLKDSKVGPIHNQNALDIANLATVYVLSGEEKYGEYAKKLLLGYAEAFPNYAPGNRPGFNHDSGKLFDQRLSDATWLIPTARGYDLIYNLPSISPEERTKIENDLIKASAQFIAANAHTLRAPTNWSAICTTAVLIAGYATDDEELVTLALYGPKGTKEDPKGGVMLHFSEKSIAPDGMWSEGAMGYQGMAMQALVMNAEILRHHGIDMYNYRDAAFKSLFDSPLDFSYPDLTAPAIHDSGRANIVGREAYLWEFGYKRYRDPKYLTILRQTGKHLDTQFQQFPVSVLYDGSDEADATAVEWKSTNLFDVGYGILRNTTTDGTVSLLLDYGPDRSHGHPDKMNIDLFVFGDRLIPDPGTVWYEQPLYQNWYKTTVAHNTLVVDELNQMNCDGLQLVYGFGDTIGLQRGSASGAYAGVTLDRALFLTPRYMADLFGGFATLPRKMDLAWHIRGDFSSNLATKPFTFPEPKESGYSELTDVRAASTADAYSADFQLESDRARFLAAAGGDTEVILANGILGLEHPTTILQRRQTNQTVYANLVEFDYDGTEYVKGITQEGSLEAGFGAMTIQTTDGEDYCLVSYRPGTYKAGKLQSDALQAYASCTAGKPTTLFLGGGTTLECNGASLQRDEPGLAYVEPTGNGFVVGNPSPTEGKITLKMPNFEGLEAFEIGKDDKRTANPVSLERKDGEIHLTMAANSRVEFAKAGAESLHDYRQSMLRKVREEQEAAMRAQEEAFLARDKERTEDAKNYPVPANTTLVVQAEDFTAEGGGEIRIAEKKMAAIGTSLSGWDNEGHWIEWTVEVPAEGYYNLSLVYCSQMANVERAIEINGETQEPFVPFVLPATGGYANGSDDWRLNTLTNPLTEKPLLVKFKKGANTLRLLNSKGIAGNMDYLIISSPDTAPERLPTGTAQ